MTARQKDLHIAVVGGSLGGLSAAIALQAAGFETDVYEKSTGSRVSRGGGIVLQPELADFFAAYDAQQPRPMYTTCVRRRFLDARGGIQRDLSMPQMFTSWDAIFRQLKQLYPSQRYHVGYAMTACRTEGDQAVLEFGERQSLKIDIAVCSDGSDSAARRLLWPDTEPNYAGYVAWRGYVPMRDLPRSLLDRLDDCFTFFDLPDGHFLCYPIPGEQSRPDADGRAPRHERRLNWVWYVDVSEGRRLTEMLTDRFGVTRRASVPSGRARPELVNQLRHKAGGELPPILRDLVDATVEPFLQVIWDVAVPSGVSGRVCLLGDAAFVVRPHTAAATAKAAAEAQALAAALSQEASIDAAFRRFDEFQQLTGGRLVSRGVGLGERVRRSTQLIQEGEREQPR